MACIFYRMEILGVLGLFLGIILAVRGLYVVFLKRREAKHFLGMEFTFRVWKIILLFFIFIFLLFSLFTVINFYYNLIEIQYNNKINLLLGNVFSKLSSAILEEFIFRLLIFCSLIEFLKNKTIIVLITSVIFSFFHIPENSLLFLSYTLGGIMYGYSFLKFKSIIIPIGIHFSWNYIQGIIFGYPVSGSTSEGLLSLVIIPNIIFNGGDFGPEGSVAGIIIRLCIILLIYVLPEPSNNIKFLEL